MIANAIIDTFFQKQFSLLAKTMIQDRIREMITALNLNTNSFAMRVGAGQPVIHSIIAGRRNAPRWETFEKIMEAFPEVSAEWLVRGIPPMFLDEERQRSYEQARVQAALTNNGDVNTQVGLGQMSIVKKNRQIAGVSDAELQQVRTALSKCQEEKSDLERELLKSKDRIIHLLDRQIGK